jgi:hypothetical protein
MDAGSEERIASTGEARLDGDQGGKGSKAT